MPAQTLTHASILLVAIAACSGNGATNHQTMTPDCDAGREDTPFAPHRFPTIEEMQSLLDGPIAMRHHGEGWFCYIVDQVGWTSCWRTVESCDKLRAEVISDGRTASPCEHFDRSYCLLAKMRADSATVGACHATSDACERSRQSRISQPEKYGFISTCEEIP